MQVAIDGLPFRCGHCLSPLTNAGNKITCKAGHPVKFYNNVLDLFVPDRDRHSDISWTETERNILLGYIGERVGVSADELEAIDIFGHVEPTGVKYLDAEEDLFLDRFEFANVVPKLRIINAYSDGHLQPGENWIAVRIRNEGPVTLSSKGPQPVLLSYHLLDEDGNILEFEGRRTALPIDIRSGQEITAHLAVDLAADPNSTKLQIVPVHETVRWLDDCAYEIKISATRSAQDDLVTTRYPGDFSEALDNELAADFIGKQLTGLRENSVSLEIGGGHDAILSHWHEENEVCATVINNDISIRMLKLAALKSAKFQKVRSINARFDANLAPISDAALDCILFSRSLHHFSDPVKVLKQCHRMLKDDGVLLLVCEPVGHAYDEFTKQLIRNDVNEQVFPVEGYQAICSRAGFETLKIELDWGFSLKGVFCKLC